MVDRNNGDVQDMKGTGHLHHYNGHCGIVVH